VILPGPDGKLDFDSDDVYLPGAKSFYDNPFLYTGQRYDPETGFLYYKNRYNSTFFGRFMSRDPIDYAAGDMNLYAYVGDNPTNLTDPTGNADSVTVCNPCNCPTPPAIGPCDICCFTYTKLPPMNPSQLSIGGLRPVSGTPSGKGQPSFAALESWSFGATQSGSFASRRKAGKDQQEYMKITLSDADLISNYHTPLLLACATGEDIPKSVLVCRKAGKDQQEYMKITLSDCLVSSYHTSGSGGSDIVPSEIWTGTQDQGEGVPPHKPNQDDIINLTINTTGRPTAIAQKPDGTLGGTTKAEFDLKKMKANF
jgi:type VI secretion system secreted protein Hcp